MVDNSETMLTLAGLSLCSARETGFSVNSTNALPCFDFFGCDCGHLGHRPNLVARLLVILGFCRIGSGTQSHQVLVFPGTSRISFWNLTVGVVGRVGGGSSGRLLIAAAAALGDVPSLSVVRTKALLAKVLRSLSQDHSGLRKIPFAPCHKGKSFVSRISSFPMTKSRLRRRVVHYEINRRCSCSTL
jgi:hypothetical protein